MCVSYTDGSKVCVEMALVANAFNLGVAVPGMYGHRAEHILDIFKLFDLEAIYRNNGPVVDYVIGPEPKGGVFAVGYSESEYQKHMLGWFPVQIGNGPYYVFYRPYHLIHIESMRCIAEAYLDHESLLQPTYGFRTNVFCYAKKDLQPGELLDGFGGYACYGLIENCTDNQDPGLPICLAENVTVKSGISKDQRIRMSDINYDPGQINFKLYEMACEKSHGQPD
jgi:predicted homoserine dehydrogenase-like protein